MLVVWTSFFCKQFTISKGLPCSNHFWTIVPHTVTIKRTGPKIWILNCLLLPRTDLSLKFWYLIVHYSWSLLIPLISKVTYWQSMLYFRNTFSTAYRTFIFFPRIDCGLFWHTCANTLSKLVCDESMHKFCIHSVLPVLQTKRPWMVIKWKERERK